MRESSVARWIMDRRRGPTDKIVRESFWLWRILSGEMLGLGSAYT